MKTVKIKNYPLYRITGKENRPMKATPLFSIPPDPAKCCLLLRLSDTDALSLIRRLTPNPEPFMDEIRHGLQAALGKPAYEAASGKDS